MDTRLEHEVALGSDELRRTLGETEVRRRRRKDERPNEILAAALDEFAEKGFTAARLADVARRAGIAKGTIYLYYSSKHELFRAVIRGLLPRYGEIERMVLDYPGSTEALLRGPFVEVQRQLLQTDLPSLLSVLLTEGQRVPDLVEFYYREALSPALGVARAIIQRGEFRETALVELPQPLIAGVLVAIVWNSLLGKVHPVDTGQLLETHIDLLLDGLTLRTTPGRSRPRARRAQAGRATPKTG
jgi:AcrR family transcriptional regulator